MRYLAARPARAARGMGLGIALALAALAMAQAAFGAGASQQAADLAAGPNGTLVDPNGRTWVSDAVSGFCRVTEPTAFAFGAIEPGTCVAGPGTAGQAALLHQGANFFAFIPDAAAQSSNVFRSQWNPLTGLFGGATLIPIPPDVAGQNVRPQAASPDPAGADQVYVVGFNSAFLQRINAASTALPTVEHVANITGPRPRGVAATQLGPTNALTVYVSTGAGVENVAIPAVVPPLPPTAPAAFNPAAARALAYDALNHVLYAGTNAAAAPADAGIDFVQALNTTGGDGGGVLFSSFPAFPGFTAFTAIGGLRVAKGGAVVAADPGGIAGGATGLARTLVVGPPVAHSGPPVNPATGLTSPNTAFINSPTPRFSIGGDAGITCTLRTIA